MNPPPDDEDWLLRIGVTTADTSTTSDTDNIDNTDRDIVDLDAAAADQPAATTVADSPAATTVADSPAVAAVAEQPADTARRFTRWVAAVFAAVAIAATAATAGLAALTSHGAAEPVPAHAGLIARPTIATPPTTAPRSADAPIPFTASADCPPGSTAAQSLADPHATTPWICARTVDGQVLTIDLGRAYVITAVSIVPGAIVGGDDQTDPWGQHRVVTRIQWRFNDVDQTVRNQNTGNVRGEAVLSLPSVLASAITAIIQQTSRPPTTAPTPDPGPILGAAPSTDPPRGHQADEPPDPSDGTFAVTSIKVIGHQAT